VRVAQLLSSLASFEEFLEQSQIYAITQADDEQLKQCEKALPECNGYLSRLATRLNDKFTKVKTLFPVIPKDEITTRRPVLSPEEEKANRLKRKSSVVADRLWEELCSEKVEKPSPRSLSHRKTARGLTPHPEAVESVNPDVTNTPVIPETNELVHEAGLSIEEILAQGNEEEIARLMDDLEAETSNKLGLYNDEESSDDIVGDDETDVKLETMGDISFDELLEGLVMTTNEDNVSGVEFLMSKLAALRSQYTAVLGSDADQIFGDLN